MLERGSFYARHRARQRRAVLRRLRRDVPELRVAEEPPIFVRAAALAVAGLPVMLMLTVVIARA